MKITLEVSGGFAHIPGLSRPIVVDTEEMDHETSGQIEELVRNARFFEQPERPENVRPGAADYRTYLITVEDGVRARTIQLIDPIADRHLEELVSRLRAIRRPPDS